MKVMRVAKRKNTFLIVISFVLPLGPLRFRECGGRHLSRTALAGAAWHPYVCAPNRLEDGAAGQPALCLTAGRGGAVAARPNEVYGCKGRAFGKVGETFLR